MAVVAEELISDLIVRDGKLRSGIRSAQQAYGAGVGSMRNDTKRFESEFNRSSTNISTGFKQLAGTLAAGVSIAATSQLIDSYTRLQNSLRVAGLEGQKLEAVQSSLLDLSSRYGVSVNELANLYGKSAQAASDLGASSAQLLQITEASAQALKITGTAAQQAQGALLGLTQALSSGIVRAEEFNQINEGGLRPLLQAAANAERFGGSVAKLRAAVVDGKFSSQEFYQAILQGSEQLESQAAKATLTLAGAFEALSGRLTVYVGSAAASSGVTGALAAGIKALAENLDTIIPALATIAALIGVRYVAALAAATVSSVGLRLASVGLAVSLNGVRAAAVGAGSALITAMGGPVSAAIIAVGAALVFLSAVTDDAVASVEELKASNATAADELQAMIGRLKAAGVETKEFAAAADAAANAVDGMADSYRRALIEARKFNKESGAADFSETVGAISGIDDQIARLRSQRNAVQLGNPGQKIDSGGVMAQIDEQIRQLVVSRAQQVVRRDLQIAGIQNGVDVTEDAPRPGSPAAAKPPKKARGRSGPSAEDLAEQERQRSYREEQELRSLLIEEKRAKEDLAATADERAKLQRESLALERDQRLAEVNEAERRKDLTGEEAKARRTIIENLYGAADEIKVQARESAYEERITREQKRDAERDRADIAQTELDIRRDELQFQLDMAETQAERRRIALQILEAETATQRAALEGVKATEAVNSAKWRQADADLRALDARAGRDAQRIGRDTENPLERLARESSRTAAQVTEDIQSIQAEGLNALGDGITDVIMQTRSLGDVFKSVANQIISDLIRIAVQRAIIGPLANALFPGTSALTGTSGGMDLRGFKAGGGAVQAGALYRVNEGQKEFFRPATSGQVIPLSGMTQAQAARPAASAMQGPTIVQLAVAPGEMFVPIVEGISGNVAVRTVQATAGGLVQAANLNTIRRAQRPRL